MSRTSTSSRFNRLAWGHVDERRPQGVIAAGLENGELALWDPAKILTGVGYSHHMRHLILADPKNTVHLSRSYCEILPILDL